MFHLKNLINTLGLCLCAVLLLVPATSNAMPADDEHFALPHSDATVLPGDGEAKADGTTCSFHVAPPMGQQCRTNCEKSHDGCMDSCPSGWEGMGCRVGCGVAQEFCIHGCRFTSY